MKAIKITVLSLTNISSLRKFLRKPALWTLLTAVLAFSVATSAQESQMTVTQLGSSACTAGYYFPSIDAAVKKVAFNSFCDLVPGENTDGNSELFVMNVNGSGLKQLTSSVGGLGVINPQISWSGLKIVFASDRDLISGGNTDGNYEIFTINVDGSGLTQLTNTTGGRFVYGFQGNTAPCFDPRAQKIVFSSDRDLIPGGNSDGNNDLFAMNTDGSGLVQLTSTTGGWGIGDGCLNVNDTQVILDSDRDLVPGGNADGNYEVFTMKANGTGLVQLTNTTSPASGIGNVNPIWTSDAKTVFFRSDIDWTGGNPDLNQEVFRMKIDGSNKVQMTNSAGGFGSTATGINLNGKVLAVESDGDLVPGNNVNHNGRIYIIKFVP
jgi:Tol biopolymer transport system component